MTLSESINSRYIRKVGTCTAPKNKKYNLSISDKGEYFYFSHQLRGRLEYEFGDVVIIAKLRAVHNPNFVTWDLHEVTLPRSKYLYDCMKKEKDKKKKKLLKLRFMNTVDSNFKYSYIVQPGKWRD